MQPLNYNTMKCLLVSGDFLWYYINLTNRGVSGLTFKTTFCTVHSQIKLRSFSIILYLLILEFNICMKQRTEIPSNQRGELLFTFILLVNCIFC